MGADGDVALVVGARDDQNVTARCWGRWRQRDLARGRGRPEDGDPRD